MLFRSRRVLERGIPNIAIGCFWDPVAVRQCAEAGVGAHIDICIGGRHGPASGNPVSVEATVKQWLPTHSQVAYDNAINPLGAAAWLELDNNVHVVMISTRTQTYSPGAFTDLGLELTELDAVVVKSTQHFYEKFSALSTDVCYVSTPGAMRTDFENIPYSHLEGDYWPKVADPLRLDEI